DAAPEEERETRCERQVADAVGLPRREVGRLRLTAVNELRIGEDALQRGLDPVIEAPALFPACAIELQQAVDVGGVHGTTEGMLGEARHDRARARRLFARCLRRAQEDLAAARRVGGPL